MNKREVIWIIKEIFVLVLFLILTICSLIIYIIYKEKTDVLILGVAVLILWDYTKQSKRGGKNEMNRFETAKIILLLYQELKLDVFYGVCCVALLFLIPESGPLFAIFASIFVGGAFFNIINIFKIRKGLKKTGGDYTGGQNKYRRIS